MSPSYPTLADSPVVKVWDRASLGSDWEPPACTGWTTPGFSTLVIATGRFPHTTGAAGLLRRIGAISELKGVRYWSTTHKEWRTLILEAYAVSGPDGGRRRRDFSPDEIASDQVVHFLQQDNLSGKATYRLRMLSVSPDRIVFDMENVTALKYYLLTLFAPGELQSIYFLDRESEGIWRFYSVTRSGRKASGLTSGHDASSINRAVAFYRHLTGVPTDMEPPAAR